MRILITDYYAASNRGDAAILDGLIHSIKTKIPSAEFEVITENTTAAELLHDINVNEQMISVQQWKEYWKQGEFPKSVDNMVINLYKNADLIISTGGHHITEDYFPGKIGMLMELYYCSRLAAPVALVGQTIGPVKNIIYRKLVKTVLNRVDLITVRDQKSLSVVKSLGITTPTKFTADAAFSMPTVPLSTPKISSRRVQDELSIKKETSTLVTISPREVRSFYNTSVERNYIECLAHVADNIIRKGDYYVVFVPTCTSLAGYSTDDRIISHRIVDQMDEEGARIIMAELSHYEIYSVYNQADLHIGTRMHSCILAAKSGTPLVALEYQYKLSELMSQLSVEEYGLAVDTLTSERLNDVINNVIGNSNKISKKIKKSAGKIQNESMKNGDLVKILTE